MFKNQKIHSTLLLLIFCLSVLLSGCGGAEDGDLVPPNATYEGGLPLISSLSGPFTLTGTADLGSTIDIDVITPLGVISVGPPDDFSGGIWTVEINDLEEGLNQITIDVSDEIGNSNILFLTTTIDQTGPVVTLDQYATPTPVSSQVMAGTVGEVGAKVLSCIKVDALTCDPDTPADWTEVDDVNGDVWILDHDFVTDESYRVQVRACDQTPPLDLSSCGNYSTEIEEAIVKVDSSSPAPTLTISGVDLPAVAIPGFSGIIPYFYMPDPDPLVTPSVTFDGTMTPGSTLTSSITSGTAVTPDVTLDPLWSAQFSGFGSGSTVATITVDDGTLAGPGEAKILIVRDLTAASVTDTVPAHGDSLDAAERAALTALRVIFSESMDFDDVNNINQANMTVEDSDGNVITINGVSPVGTMDREYDFSIDPADLPLTAGGIYTVTLAADETYPVADAAGNGLDRTFSWTFRTDPP